MRYRQLDHGGDMQPVTQAAQLLSGASAVAQALKTRLRFYKGEWYEDAEEGFALMDEIISDHVDAHNMQGVDHLITAYILETEGVRSVSDVAIYTDKSMRSMTYVCCVHCEDGIITLEVNGNGVSAAVSG